MITRATTERPSVDARLPPRVLICPVPSAPSTGPREKRVWNSTIRLAPPTSFRAVNYEASTPVPGASLLPLEGIRKSSPFAPSVVCPNKKPQTTSRAVAQPRKKFNSCVALNMFTEDSQTKPPRKRISRVSTANLPVTPANDTDHTDTVEAHSSSNDDLPTLESLLDRYSGMVLPSADSESSARLLGEFFAEMATILPGKKTTLDKLGNLARSLCGGSNKRLPARHKVVGRTRNDAAPGQRMSLPLSVEGSEESPEESPQERRVQKKQTSMPIPRLNLEGVQSKVAGYNEEFLSKIDQFSLSWRKDCHSMKTCKDEKDMDA